MWVKSVSPGITLSRIRLYFLIRHYDFFDEKPFSSNEEMRQCWEQHRADILARKFDPFENRVDFEPGTRPWAFWYFDQNCQPPYPGQASVLDELGLLSPEEKEATIALARAAWVKHSRCYAEPIRANALLATDQDLLDSWPEVWATQFSRQTNNLRRPR